MLVDKILLRSKANSYPANTAASNHTRPLRSSRRYVGRGAMRGSFIRRPANSKTYQGIQQKISTHHRLKFNSVYSQYTFRVSPSEVELPTLLLATHLYRPASDRWRLITFKVWMMFLETALSRGCALIFNCSPFFVQVTLGGGFPNT